jgi:hypothetical protein
VKKIIINEGPEKKSMCEEVPKQKGYSGFGVFPPHSCMLDMSVSIKIVMAFHPFLPCHVPINSNGCGFLGEKESPSS